MGKTVERAVEGMLPAMVQAVRTDTPDEGEVQARVLTAYMVLAGMTRYKRGMAASVKRAMQVAAAALLVAGALLGQATVAETQMVAGDGSLARGTIRLRATAPFIATDGKWVDQSQATVYVVNGAFSVAMEGNVGDTAYEARWQLYGARPRLEWWVVPASGTVRLCAVRATRVSGAWVVAGCGGGGGSLRWSTLTNSQWTGMTNSQWTGLAN